MLAEQPIDVMLLATDLGIAKRFVDPSGNNVGLLEFKDKGLG